MRRLGFALTVSLLGLAAQAAPVLLDTDPFAGTTALTTPGRQVVGAEPSITFDPATDQFVIGAGFNLATYAPGLTTLSVASGPIASIPTSGANVIVLGTFDDDASAGTPFGAGNAANLIAGRVTDPGAGFFIYFNSALDVARLVFSTDLDDPTADLRILARMTNLSGASGRAALAQFGAGNFAFGLAVPEPPTLALVLCAAILGGWTRRRTVRHR